MKLVYRMREAGIAVDAVSLTLIQCLIGALGIVDMWVTSSFCDGLSAFDGNTINLAKTWSVDGRLSNKRARSSA
jgi:hypothetical protein